MHSLIYRTLALASVVFLAFGWIQNAAAAGTLKVGVATSDITPPLGVPLAGYYHERGADGVLDPLRSKAMVLENDGERVALVVVDLIGLTRWVTEQARSRIEQETGIPGRSVMISATHAHTGPELSNRGRRSAEIGSEKPETRAYTEHLPALIAESVRLANDRVAPARLSAGRGSCPDLTFNRRYFMRDGTTGWNPGKLNPQINLPAGGTDPEVRVVYFEPAEGNDPGKAIATYVNFAMHPDTTGGTRISADWPGALSRVLAGYHGSNHVTVVANGTCGNLNHVDVSWKWPQSGPGEQNRIGALLGAAVFETYKTLHPIEAGKLRARSQMVHLALPELGPGEAEAARLTIQNIPDDRGTNFMKLVRAYRMLDIAARQGEPFQLEVQVISLGREVAWVGLPGEIFVELGLALQKRSPFPHTLIAELANDNIGYVPDRRSFAEGAYEPESARCLPGAGEQLIDAAVSLLQASFEAAVPDSKSERR
jgi:hypothetical protein